MASSLCFVVTVLGLVGELEYIVTVLELEGGSQRGELEPKLREIS